MIAKAHRLFIVKVTDNVPDKASGRTRYVPAWVVYRSAPRGERPVRIGKRRDPGALLHFVRKLTGETHA